MLFQDLMLLIVCSNNLAYISNNNLIIGYEFSNICFSIISEIKPDALELSVALMEIRKMVNWILWFYAMRICFKFHCNKNIHFIYVYGNHCIITRIFRKWLNGAFGFLMWLCNARRFRIIFKIIAGKMGISFWYESTIYIYINSAWEKCQRNSMQILVLRAITTVASSNPTRRQNVLFYISSLCVCSGDFFYSMFCFKSKFIEILLVSYVANYFLY